MISTIITIILICLGVFALVHIAPFIFREIAADIIKKKKTDVADTSNAAGIPKMSDDPRTSGATSEKTSDEDSHQK